MFAATPMPIPPNFNEQNVFTKPQPIYDRPLLDPTTVAAVQENWRQELESLQAVDDAVARIVGTLERTGELQNTLILYTSDNGFMHGEHRVKSGKVWPYEEASRVPLIARGPGVPAGFRDARPVANIDVAPTIVDAADAQPQRVLDGRSLFGLMADPGLWWGRDILLENGRGANGVPAYRAIRTGRFIYIQHRSTGEYELYDLERDPFQLSNLDGVPAYASVQRDLAKRLRLLRNCAGRGCQKAPGLRLGVRSAGSRVEPGRCVRGPDLSLRLAGRDRLRVASAVAFVGKRRIARVAGRRIARVADRPITRRVRRPDLRPGRRYLLRVKTELHDGRIYTLDRRVRACR
jgi:hypothetical protein